MPSNVDVSNLYSDQSETAIAINPTNHLNMIAGSNDFRYLHQTAYWTNDGGVTWTAVDLGPSSFSDPSVAFDRHGNAYFSFVEDVGGIGLKKSTDGGKTWGATLEIAPAGRTAIQDKPFVAIGPDHNNVSVDRIYVAWDNEDIGDVLEVRSSSDGINWGNIVAVDGVKNEIFAQPAVGPNGEFYVAWFNFGVPNQSSIMFSSSLNDGATFSVPVQAALSNINPFNPGSYFLPAQPDRTITPAPSIAVDTTSGVHRGRVYITYTDAKAGLHNDTDVKLIASDNGGAAWNALGANPIRLNDDATSTSQFFSAVALDPTNGSLSFAWYDARNDPNNQKVDVYEAQSFDGGQTISANRRVTTVQSDNSVNNPQRNRDDYGDYIGIAAYGSLAHPVWADTRFQSTLGEEIFTEAFTWVNQVSGDFNGDGKTDIAEMVQETGQWFVRLSNGSSFTSRAWTTWDTTVAWANITVGDFNGDGKMDIAARNPQTGDWWVSLSNGSSFTTTNWHSTWATNITWVDVNPGDYKLRDFNGDGKSDIIGRNLQTGQWTVGLSTGSSFSNSIWAAWSTGVTWVDAQVGPFNGGNAAGIAARVSNNSPFSQGQWWVGYSTGSSFQTNYGTTWNASVTWVDVHTGEFDGDHQTDIVGRVLESGQWWVAVSTVPGFTNYLFTTWSTAVTWVDVRVGDFNGDGLTDIAGMVSSTGQWWVGLCTGGSFNNTLWTTWSTNVTWSNVQVGDFNGDGKADIAGLEATSWWVSLSTGSSFNNNSLWWTS